VATFLVALAAFDYFYLNGEYLHSVQAAVNSYPNQLMTLQIAAIICLYASQAVMV
jgi:hypothetical protein